MYYIIFSHVNSISSSLHPGSHEIASRMRSSVRLLRFISNKIFATGEQKFVPFILFSRIFSIKYIQAGTEMSTSNGERHESSGNAEFSHETGIGALAGILQGIQTMLADLSASSKAQTAAFQSIQEDILLRDADDEDDTAHSTVDLNKLVNQATLYFPFLIKM